MGYKVFKSAGTKFIKMAMKGISPMIATVLLLAFTVAVGGVLSIWISGLTTSQTATVENRSSGVMKCSPGLIIEKVDVPAGTGLVNITYWNGGQFSISGIVVEVINMSLSTAAADSATLVAGQMGSHRFNLLSGAPATRIRVKGNCQGGPVADDCDATEACWNAV